MSKTYDDPRFAVSKLLTFPGHCDSVSAAGNPGGTVSHIVLPEDIVLTEFGVVITEIYTNGGALCTVILKKGSTQIGTITIPSASAVGTVLSTTTLTTSADSGDALHFYNGLTSITLGECDGYVKYRERFKSG